MNSVKTKEIIKFSLYKNIQNKWFIIFNVITLLSLIIMTNWSSLSSLFETNEEVDIFKVAVLDNSNLIYDNFANALDEMEEIEFERITENTYTAENIPDDFAIIEIIPDSIEGFKTSIISKEGISTTIYNPIKDALFELRNNILSEKYSLTNDTIEIFQTDLSVNRIMLGVDNEDSEIKELIKFFSSDVTYLLTIMIFSKMANEIAQEKQSKSSEYILTTVSAKEYLFAKIFSNIAILLLQGLLLFVYYFIAIGIVNIINIASTDLTLSSGVLAENLSFDTIFYVLALIVINILNLILLCIIQATLSAKTASTSEAGNTVSLLVFIMMAAYIATIYVLTPSIKVSGLLYFISCLPIISAYFVPGMMIIGQATTIQIIISLALLIFSIPLTFNFCSNIFKNGILDYTKVKKKKEDVIDSAKQRELFLTKRKFRNIGFVTGLGILIYIGSQTIFALLLNLVLPTLLSSILSDTDTNLISQILLQILSLGLASSFVLAYCNKNNLTTSKRHLTNFSKFKIVLIAVLAIFVLQILLSVVLYPKLGLDYNVTDMFEIDYTAPILSKIILVFALAVTPAIFEELFFRKALIDFTLPYSKTFALLFSSLLFGIIHMNLSQGIFAFIVGLIFGSIYLYTNSIKLPMLIHFINNGFAAISMVVPESTVVLLTLILILFLIVGFVFLIKTLLNSQSRNKIKNYLFVPVNLPAIKNKYIYIFSDFIFDISMLLVLVMSILTENILR